MATRTFKIGEYARGGVITVEITKGIVHVIGKNWDFSAGSKKSSNQSNAKEFDRESIAADNPDSKWKVEMALFNLTTSYYSDIIMKWIKTKIQLN